MTRSRPEKTIGEIAELLLWSDDWPRARSRLDLVAEDFGTPEAFFDDVMAPALREVGRLWVERQVSAADEHRATERVRDLLGVLKTGGPFPIERTEHRRRAVTAAVEGEAHNLAAGMVAAVLELRGWRVDHLGSNVPAADLAEFVAREAPHAVFLSVTSPRFLVEAYTTLHGLRSETRGRPPLLVVGGQPFEVDPSLRDRFPADVVAENLAGAMRAVDAKLARAVDRSA